MVEGCGGASSEDTSHVGRDPLNLGDADDVDVLGQGHRLVESAQVDLRSRQLSDLHDPSRLLGSGQKWRLTVASQPTNQMQFLLMAKVFKLGFQKKS